MKELIQENLAVARGEQPAELVLREVRIVDVYSGEIFLDDLAIHRGQIIGWGDYQGVEERFLEGRYLVPGLIDAHVHLESSMVLPDEFCRQVVARGTTTVVADPHEVANVAGIKGIQFIRQYQNYLPINLLINLPCCVPATPVETSGAVLKAKDLQPLLDQLGIHGLGEVMDFYGVIQGDTDLLDKIQLMKGRFIDGHAPLLKGKDLNAYVLAGIMADHETTNVEEAREKIRRGLYVMIREGSAAKDLLRLLHLVQETNSRRFCFCTDDRHPEDLVEDGHMDFVIRKAVETGFSPIEAIRMATLNAAECLMLPNLGGIAPGKRADLVVVDDLYDFRAYQVYKDGCLVAKKGEMLQQVQVEPEIQLLNTVNVAELHSKDLQIPQARLYRLIWVQPDQLLTKEVQQSVKMADQGLGQQILEPDVAKIVVVERYQGSGRVGVGLVKGFGLREGAIASSVAHDSHHLMAVGRDDQSILTALQAVIREQGGLSVTKGDIVLGLLPLPIAGLLSDQKLEWVKERMSELQRVAYDLGVELTDPFMTLSFMALPVIPDLKVTSKGLFDVVKNEYVSLVVE